MDPYQLVSDLRFPRQVSFFFFVDSIDKLHLLALKLKEREFKIKTKFLKSSFEWLVEAKKNVKDIRMENVIFQDVGDVYNIEYDGWGIPIQN
jgi:hypothetical protein